MVTLTTVVIMVISLASEALMLMLTPMLMLTITVTTHTQPVTMVATWASVALTNNLHLILNLMPMVTIPAITVDGDTVDTADITGAKLTDQTTSLFFLTDFFPDSMNKIQKLINSS